jgi:6-phosphogluconolactonase/glucosamine-6-phosphate isomerase/deaminase
MTSFPYSPSAFVPFNDRAVCNRIRTIPRDRIADHSNPDFQIRVVRDEDIAFLRIHDLFSRIKESDEKDKRLVLILPQPHPQYAKVAYLINKYRVSCRNLYTFNMDEWADEDGNTAPETYANGFMYAMLENFYGKIAEELRPPRDHIHGITTRNISSYAGMMEDVGGVDLCDGGIGWSGHVAFVEPNAPEFAAETVEEWASLGPRLVTLTPFTLAQTALDPDFGMSGDWSWVPPKAATIGPAQILGARLRNSWNHFTIAGTNVSWQRFSVRLACHGPVTPAVPASMLQTARTNMYISESIAEDIVSTKEMSFYS